jgi:S1-C subfamily serine protease
VRHCAGARQITRAGRTADASKELQVYQQLKEVEENVKQANNGAAITELMPGGPAQKAGLKLGDVILAANGKRVADMNDFHLQIARMGPGATVKLTIMRDGRRIEIPVTMTEGKLDRAAPQAASPRSAQEHVRP